MVEAEIQLLLKRFPNSSVSSLIRSWLMLRRASGHQKLALIPMDSQLMVTGPLVVELTLVKCHRSPCWSNPSLSWKKANVFKINGNDDDDDFIKIAKLDFLQKKWNDNLELMFVWKQECSATKKGGLLLIASTRFSIIVQSISSFWRITSFLSILIAYNSSVPFLSASTTWKQRAWKKYITESREKRKWCSDCSL